MDTLGHQKDGQMGPGWSLEANMTKLKLPCFRHMVRKQRSLEKTIMLGETEGSRKRGRPNVRQIDSIK